MYNIAAVYNTGEFHGHCIKYSPFSKDLLACAASQNYGIKGHGILFILDLQNRSAINVLSTKQWAEGLLGVTWSEESPNQLVTSSVNGSIQLWDYLASTEPFMTYKIHEKEVYSVDWNPRNSYTYILSASFDNTVKLWNPYVNKEVAAFLEHTDHVYEARWSAVCHDLFVSVSGDKSLRLWDIRSSNSSQSCYPHDTEVLCCDWSRMDTEIIATGTRDGRIFEWDIRKMLTPIFMLSGHEFAIRQLKFSHLERGRIASVSYDNTTRFWNWNIPYALQTHKSHTEFVHGLDFSPMKQDEVADCAWDSLICIYSDKT